MEIEDSWRSEWQPSGMDGELPDRKTDADSSEGKEIGVERGDQWSAAGFGARSHYVLDLC